MKLRDLINYTQQYAGEYPNMLDNEVIIATPYKRATKGSYYKSHHITGLGFNALVAKDQLVIDIATQKG